jgi:hypothetical protein
MPMNPQLLAAQWLAAIGGEITPQRLATFQQLANVLVAHITANATLNISGVTAGVNTVVVPPPGAIL